MLGCLNCCQTYSYVFGILWECIVKKCCLLWSRSSASAGFRQADIIVVEKNAFLWRSSGCQFFDGHWRAKEYRLIDNWKATTSNFCSLLNFKRRNSPRLNLNDVAATTLQYWNTMLKEAALSWATGVLIYCENTLVMDRNSKFKARYRKRIWQIQTFCMAVIAARIDVCCASNIPNSSLNSLSWFSISPPSNCSIASMSRRRASSKWDCQCLLSISHDN